MSAEPAATPGLPGIPDVLPAPAGRCACCSADAHRQLPELVAEFARLRAAASEKGG